MALEVDSVARHRFGIGALHPWQRTTIDELLRERSQVLLVAPTGGGKSLTYQLPAVMLEGTALVLSPLVALMEDQVRALTAHGIPATFLASTLEPDERRRRERLALEGAYKLIYVAPERLAFDSFTRMVARCNLSLVAVDEAHCISEWGHDFRPDYLRIGQLLEELRPARVIACTATATPEVQNEIAKHLGFAADAPRILRGFARPNLHLSATMTSGPKEAKEKTLDAVRKHTDNGRRGAAIVYVATRKAAEDWADMLQRKGLSADYYHAGADPEHRGSVHARFAKRKLSVIVATNAFGMGIDRPDIRLVVHGQPPASTEAYYQEVGRAGRDGDEAHGLLLCSDADIHLRRFLCESPSEEGMVDARRVERSWGLFRGVLRYIDARTCRHDFILRYFGDESEVLGGCGHCDVCLRLEASTSDPAETARTVRIALSAVARAKGRGGLESIVEMLVGAKTERAERFGFFALSTFGLLRSMPGDWVRALLRGLLAAGWIDLTADKYPIVKMTPAGWTLLRAEGEVPFLLPSLPSATSDKKRSRKGSKKVAAPEDGDLYSRLREARAALARTHRVPAYVVAHDATLVEMAAQRPSTLEHLSLVRGFGAQRAHRYGRAFLDVLALSAAE